MIAASIIDQIGFLFVSLIEYSVKYLFIFPYKLHR